MSNKQAIAKELREMADYLESRDFKLEASDSLFGGASIYLSCETIPSFKQNIKAMGAFEKGAGSDLEAHRKIGCSTLQVYIARSKVCRKIITGKKIVPAQPAIPEKEVDTYEYKCPKSFHDIPDNMEELVSNQN